MGRAAQELNEQLVITPNIGYGLEKEVSGRELEGYWLSTENELDGFYCWTYLNAARKGCNALHPFLATFKHEYLYRVAL